MRIRFTWMFFAGLAIVASGCFRDVILDHHSASMPNDQKALVETKNGWMYHFAAGEYAMGVDSTGARVLRGSGLRQRRAETLSAGFSGIIPIVDIDRVTVVETTPWLYISISGFVAAIALGIWLGWLPASRVG